MRKSAKKIQIAGPIDFRAEIDVRNGNVLLTLKGESMTVELEMEPKEARDFLGNLGRAIDSIDEDD